MYEGKEAALTLNAKAGIKVQAINWQHTDKKHQREFEWTGEL